MEANYSTQVKFSLDVIQDEINKRNELFENEVKWINVSIKNKSIEAFYCNDKKLGYPSIKCSINLNCSAATLYNFLVKDILETAKKWNPAFKKAVILEQFNDNEQILVMYYQKPPARAREDLFYRIFGHKNKHYFEHSIGLVDYPNIPFYKKSLVRSGLYYCTKDIRAISETSCKYDVMWHYNPKGKIASILPKKIVSKLVLNDLLGELGKLEQKYK